MIVYRYDKNGFYKEDVVLKENETIPSDCVKEQPPSGLFKAKLGDGQWEEGLSQAEIDTIKNFPQPLSVLDQLRKQQELMQAALDDLILGGML